MEMKEIESAVEGILFASGEPVQTDRICVALEMDHPTVEQVLQKLMDEGKIEEFTMNHIAASGEAAE